MALNFFLHYERKWNFASNKPNLEGAFQFDKWKWGLMTLRIHTLIPPNHLSHIFNIKNFIVIYPDQEWEGCVNYVRL